LLFQPSPLEDILIKLHGTKTSPYVRHCSIALKQEGMAFDFVTSDMSLEMPTPSLKIPFLQDGDLSFFDSTSILCYIRQKAGKPFFADAALADRYCLANVALDTGINLFLLEKDGFTDSPYLVRQNARMRSSFAALEEIVAAGHGEDDSYLRIACLLGWVRFRNRFDFSGLPHLCRFLEQWEQDPFFVESAP